MEAYRILDTDIDFHVQYYKDNTICEIFFCTYAGGWGHKQQSIKIEFLWEGCYNYRICDKSGKDPIISEYKSDKKEDIFIAIDEYLISACDNNIKRNIKLINLLDA